MNVFLKAIEPENAPKALGPYSPAVKLGDFVYLSGQIPFCLLYTSHKALILKPLIQCFGNDI